MPFVDRSDAGRKLAARLEYLRDDRPVVLALPRGGVPVAFEVAQALDAPLDVIVVRKLGVPFQPELGMGAIGEEGTRVLNPTVVRDAGVSEEQIAAVERRERAELERRIRRFRGTRERVPVAGRTVIVVDDGIATGSTARAACQVARDQGAARVVLAAPVAPPESLESLGHAADEVVCVESPEYFFAIGQWYSDFSQTPDEEVVALLERAGARGGPRVQESRDETSRAVDEDVEVRTGTVLLPGHLTLPGGTGSVVVFAHGSGSSRHSSRNQFVASALNRDGLGTLLFDLLTEEEGLLRENVFDIALLSRRVTDATDWLRDQPVTRNARIGYFGASTGAGAALLAAAEPRSEIGAVVSRGGRPDLAAPRLGEVRAPTLLIVGGQDEPVLELNREARAHLRCENRLEIVPGATHLFEEPGALRAVTELASSWFTDHLADGRC
jgi:putative phosphoribosyl transferase